jgi:hypothetical protein
VDPAELLRPHSEGESEEDVGLGAADAVGDEGGVVAVLAVLRLDGSLYELLEEKYGERPHRAKESLEPVCAGVREAEALGVGEGAPLMLVERTAYSRAGRPLEFARDLFRGDRTRVVVWASELAGEI